MRKENFSNNKIKQKDSRLAEIDRRLKEEINYRKRLEEKLYATNQALAVLKDAHRRAERELIESYRHAGLVNRKVSVLLDLDRAHDLEKKQELMEHILKTASNLSGAEASFIYKYQDQDGVFCLLSSAGKKQCSKNVEYLNDSAGGLLQTIEKDKVLIKGSCSDYKLDIFNFDKDIKYFVAIPLSRRIDNKLKGILILGFHKEKRLDPKDIEFYNVFATHASSALLSSEILT